MLFIGFAVAGRKKEIIRQASSRMNHLIYDIYKRKWRCTNNVRQWETKNQKRGYIIICRLPSPKIEKSNLIRITSCFILFDHLVICIKKGKNWRFGHEKGADN
jgi:hypothetical protein